MPSQQLTESDWNSAEASFDGAWYRAEYPDVDASGMSAYEHYQWIGRLLGRRGHADPDEIDPAPMVSSLPVHTVEPRSMVPNPANLHDLPAMPDLSDRWSPGRLSVTLNRPVDLAPLWRTFNPEVLNIHWLITSVDRGDIRLDTLIDVAAHIAKRGHHQTVWVLAPSGSGDGDAILDVISRWYAPISGIVVRALPVDAEGVSGDAVIATDTWSAYAAAAMPLFKARFQFVSEPSRDFDLSDPGAGVSGFGVRNGFLTICAGTQAAKAVETAGGWARSIGRPVCDVAVSRGAKKRDRAAFSVACFVADEIDDCVRDLGMAALAEIKSRVEGFNVVFVGKSVMFGALPFDHTTLAGQSRRERMSVFADCDVGLVLSNGGWSVAHTEMAAAGLPAVALSSRQSRVALAGMRVNFASADPLSLAETLVKTASKPGAQRAKSAEFVTAEAASDKFIKALQDGLSLENKPVKFKAALANVAYPHKAAIVIPTWNAGDLFRQVLEAVTTQKTDWSYEILVVDSGSRDNTLQIVADFADRGVRIHTIPNSEFQHGRTRNFAISMTNAEFVAVITQDATPAGPQWLGDLVKAFDAGDRVAGVFGGHLPYPEATPYTQAGIVGHFEHFARLPKVAHWSAGDDGPIRFGTMGWQQWLHYYSDNNSCMRRSVWDAIPYPDIDWGEDQVWAWEIVKQGYQKVFAGDAVVYHSHNLSFDEQFKVSKTEGQFWLRHFGYRFESSPEGVEASIDYLNERDRAEAERKGIAKSMLEEQMRLNRAGVSGRYIGQAELVARVLAGRDR